jgi:hypothetical protein
MDRQEWPAFANGKIWIWKLIEGMDVAVGEQAKWIGAARFGAAMAAGKPEAIAHQEAEAAAYSAHFGVRYAASFGNIIMPKITTKNKSP